MLGIADELLAGGIHDEIEQLKGDLADEDRAVDLELAVSHGRCTRDSQPSPSHPAAVTETERLKAGS